jgi:ribonuclease HI
VDTGRIRIFTDGACSGNPGPGGWGAIVVAPGEAGVLRVKELGGGQIQTTNNRMELLGAIAALKYVSSIELPVDLFTDSTYVIHGITRWVHGWKRNGWSKSGGGSVLNRDLWEALDALHAERRRKGPVEWKYVRGHSGNPGNERVDQIAVAYSLGNYIELFEGPLDEYDVDVSRVEAETAVEERPTKTGSSKPGAPKGKTVYLSLIGGVLQRHDTWKECEARVKGKPNARFRKATSPAEEAAILAGWGVTG